MAGRPRWLIALVFLSFVAAGPLVPVARAQMLHRFRNIAWIVSAGATRLHAEGQIEEYTDPAIKEGQVDPLFGVRIGVGAYAHTPRFLSARFLLSYEVRRARREVSGVFPEFGCLCDLQETRTHAMRLDYVVASAVGRFHPLGTRSGPFIGAGPSLAIPTHCVDESYVKSPLVNYRLSHPWGQPVIVYETLMEMGVMVRCMDLAIEPTLSWAVGVTRLQGPLQDARARVLGVAISLHR